MRRQGRAQPDFIGFQSLHAINSQIHWSILHRFRVGQPIVNMAGRN